MSVPILEVMIFMMLVLVVIMGICVAIVTFPFWGPVIGVLLLFKWALSPAPTTKTLNCLDVIVPFKEALVLEDWDAQIKIGDQHKSLFAALHWLREKCNSDEQFKAIPDPEVQIVEHMKKKIKLKE
jgi:Na+/H+ antiporter NhaC